VVGIWVSLTKRGASRDSRVGRHRRLGEAGPDGAGNAVSGGRQHPSAATLFRAFGQHEASEAFFPWLRFACSERSDRVNS